ncbi:unnamed protein product [Porites evermanni]|uniref:G-protein coupled receptors family 1 profile domain-containing protein n=1 Tax=Porites evermanni TaxID=104178 RepID=A0ABN8QBU4_9CNID|nr:unnamed protein product [Porites evermanni]
MTNDTAAIAILCLLGFLSFIVFISNTFTVFVFWIHRKKLTRTSFLVINLAVADLFSGLTEIIEVAGGWTLASQIASNKTIQGVNGSIPPSLQILFSFASVLFLVLISLERVFALIWPLHHRLTSTKVYIYSVVIVWLAGIAMGVSGFIALLGIYEFMYFVVGAAVIIGFSLITICVSYLSIRKRINNRTPAIDKAESRISAEQNTKLSKTLFIVIGAYAALWVPSVIWYNISVWYPSLFPYFVTHIFTMLHITNSLVNPIIYSLRIPGLAFIKILVLITVLVALLVLSVFIIIANTFTVFVFWIHRHKLKRTFLIVFNLTVADLFVGLVETVIAGRKVNGSKFMEGIPGSFLAMASGASVFFLVLVSLERAFALIWPLRHRVTTTKVYIYSVAIIWLAGLCLSALNFLTTNGIIDFRHYLFAYSIIIFLSLFVICSSYLLIRKRLCNRNPVINEAVCRKRVKQNAKYSKTFFIVIGASVTLWAPSMTLYNINNLWLGLLPGFMNYVTNFLHVTNSLVNPIIYSFRIAVFKKTLKQLANKLRICRPSRSYTIGEKI